MKYTGLLALDPGKTTGWAIFDGGGQVVDYGQENMDDLITLERLFDEHEISHIVVEDFKLFRHRASKQVGSRMEAPQVIGIAFAWSKKHNCEFIKQDPAIKPTAQKWSQLKPPSNHAQSHWVDAFNHGFYWLVLNKLRKTALEEELEREKGSSEGA